MRGVRTAGAVMAFLLAGCADDGSAAAGSIRGIVIDDIYRPVVGALVSVESVGLTATTDAVGAFELQGLEPGTYTLRVNASGHESAPQDVNVATGTATEVTLQVRRAFTECPPGDAMPRSVLEVTAANLAFTPKESTVPLAKLPMMLKVVNADPVPHEFRYQVALGDRPLWEESATIPPDGNKVFQVPIVPACGTLVDVAGVRSSVDAFQVDFEDPDLAAAGMTGRITFTA